MTTYSAFFSSGLLAPRIARSTTPVLPSSPTTIVTSPVDPIDRTPFGQISTCPKAPEASTNVDHTRIRRRRSSINIAANPMALIKSPVRNAGAALQRTGILSPTRHRASSVGMGGASETNSLFGRLRSGSVGGTSNPPKRPRRAIRVPIPVVPPPNVPLPALPSSPTAKCGSLLPPAILGPIPRQSFPASSRTADAENVYPPRLLGPDYTSQIPIHVSVLFGSRSDTIDEATMET